MIKVLTKFEKELHKIENLNVFGWKLVKFGYVRSNHKITMNIAIHVQIEMFISMVKFKWSFFLDYEILTKFVLHGEIQMKFVLLLEIQMKFVL